MESRDLTLPLHDLGPSHFIFMGLVTSSIGGLFLIYKMKMLNYFSKVPINSRVMILYILKESEDHFLQGVRDGMDKVKEGLEELKTGG